MTPPDIRDYRPLITGLLGHVAAGDLSLPGGQRPAVEELLTRLIANPELFDAYLAEVKAQRAGLGGDAERRLLDAPRVEPPGLRILAVGFAGVPDAVLADLATSPEALWAFDRTYFRGAEPPGPWFFEAIAREATTRPEPDARRATQAVRRAMRPADPPARRRVGVRLRAVAVLAAGVLIGLFVGLRYDCAPDLAGPERATLLKPLTDEQRAGLAAELLRPFPPDRRWELAPDLLGAEEPLTGVEVRLVNVGAEGRVPTLTVGGVPFRGYLTVVVLAAGRPVVFPVHPAPPIAVEPGAAADSGGFPPAARRGRVAVPVVTPTPVGEPLAGYLAGRPADPPEALADAVRRALRERHVGRFALTTAAVPAD